MPSPVDSQSTVELATSLAETRDLPTQTREITTRTIGVPEPFERITDPARSLPVIDRFETQRVLGRGGMGVVYLAVDSKLDRPIALKLLDRHRGERAAQQRMRREAQALAKLSHPNVVQVYGAGMFEERIYIAMELVEGTTLRDWQRDEARTLDEILDAYLQAGRGLAAAHAKELVHRDFKPANVMVGRDGRIRVLDFGLVRTGNTGAFEALDEQTVRQLEQDRSSSADGERIEGAEDPFEGTLTATNVVMGTPAYMAPELHQGHSASAKSDQYAFCVALHEALYGRRPFEGKGFRDLVMKVLEGTIPPAPEGSVVPPGLRRVMLRGLSVDPGRRWSSMEALLGAIERSRRPSSRRVWLGATACVALLAVAGVLAMGSESPSCPTPSEELAGVWDTSRADALGQHLLAAWSPSQWEQARAGLDDYAARWGGIHEQACTAGDGPEAFTLRSACLRQRRQALGLLVDALSSHEPKDTRSTASRVTSSLDDPSDCLEVEVLRQNMPKELDPEQLQELERIQAQLAQVRTGIQLGRYREHDPIARAALEDAQRLGHAPLVARATLSAGLTRSQTGNIPEAVALLEQAYFDAQALGDTTTMGYAAGNLVLLHAGSTGDLRVVRRWAEHARAAAKSDDDPINVLAVTGLARMLFDLAELEEAQALLEPLLASLEQQEPADEVTIAYVRVELGAVIRDLERTDEALAILLPAKATLERALGPEHPNVTSALNHIAIAYVDRGDYEQAARSFTELLEISKTQQGPDHPTVGTALANLGVVSHRRERYDESLDYYQRALERFERHYGPVSLKVAELHANISHTLDSLGRYEEAVAQRRESIRLHEELQGKLYPVFADDLERLAELQQKAGDLEGARETRERWRALQPPSAAPEPSGAPTPGPPAEREAAEATGSP